jgi:serine/threonine-protein phosphatase 2A activator
MSSLKPLRSVALDSVPSLSLPTLKIHTDNDVEKWKKTHGYHDYALFLRRLNESVVGHYLPVNGEPSTDAVRATLEILDTLDGWIDEIPPFDSPQRFGNLAFRTWGKRLDEVRLPLFLAHNVDNPVNPTCRI